MRAAGWFDGRHTKRNPFFSQFHLVHRANFGRLIFMLEHVTAFGLADDRHPGMADLTQTTAQREMARRFLAGNEVMMKPTLRRYEETAATPIKAHEFASRRPHQRIAFAAEHDHLRPRSMLVRFFVSARLDPHDVADHGVPREMETETAKADAAFG